MELQGTSTDTLQTWRIAAAKLSMSSRTVEKGWFSGFRVEPQTVQSPPTHPQSAKISDARLALLSLAYPQGVQLCINKFPHIPHFRY